MCSFVVPRSKSCMKQCQRSPFVNDDWNAFVSIFIWVMMETSSDDDGMIGWLTTPLAIVGSCCQILASSFNSEGIGIINDPTNVYGFGTMRGYLIQEGFRDRWWPLRKWLVWDMRWRNSPGRTISRYESYMQSICWFLKDWGWCSRWSQQPWCTRIVHSASLG